MGQLFIVMENVYLVISDLHMICNDNSARIDYQAETNHVIKNLVAVIDKYKALECKVYLIFLGDIIDRSFNDVTKGIIANNKMIYLRQKCDGAFSVLGNHEFSFYKDNPFWSMLTEIKSIKMKSILNKTWQPLGFLPILDVQDTIEDGNVIFNFNHYGAPIGKPITGKTNVGLFHQDIVCKDIVKDMKSCHDFDLFEKDPIYFDNTSILYGYDYAVFGHLHKIFGRWTYKCDRTGWQTKLMYNASLGRPKHDEVVDNFLERDITAFIVLNGELKCVEENRFLLMSREQCVKEDVVALHSEKYETQKEIKTSIGNLTTDAEPLDNIRAALSENDMLVQIFEQYLTSDTLQIEHDLLNRLEDIRWT